VDGRRTTRSTGLRRTVLTGLLFGLLVLVAALSGAVPAPAAGPDALRVARLVAPLAAPAVAPRWPVARSVASRSAPAAERQQVSGHDTRLAGSAVPAHTSQHTATDTVALLPDRRGPPSLVALADVAPATSTAPPGRTPATSRSRAPPTSA
jgi:hypothetical protein